LRQRILFSFPVAAGPAHFSHTLQVEHGRRQPWQGRRRSLDDLVEDGGDAACRGITGMPGLDLTRYMDDVAGVELPMEERKKLRF
jgi:hypothetical protein